MVMAIDSHCLVMMATISMAMAARVIAGLRLTIFVMVGRPTARITVPGTYLLVQVPGKVLIRAFYLVLRRKYMVPSGTVLTVRKREHTRYCTRMYRYVSK